MKDYMLIYKGGDPDWMDHTSEAQMAEVMQQWQQWLGDLAAKQLLVSGGSPLEYSGKQISPDGVVTDIAAAEFKELVSGYSIIKAETIEQAVTLAKQCPVLHSPDVTVEVREVVNLD